MSKNQMEEKHSHIINTDKSEGKERHDDMLQHHKAAAYGESKYRKKLEKIQKGDTVFLYENSAGIVAFGKASGILDTCEYDDHNNKYSMDLEDFKLLNKPMPPSEIEKAVGKRWMYPTMISITDNEAELLLEEINKNYLS